ncbi:MAG: hypothetical protein E7592_01565 [Ruminococcaceae bacterium]|nr:hypothetical protein [Oscillospiraceae bacterium]
METVMKRRFKEFEPAPFYFLNDTFDRAEIVRQLDIMQKVGIPAFYLHLRDGITTQAWGTDIFYSNVRFIAEECIKRGITMWLYDEDSYPSGQCGGQVVIDRPELEGRSLRFMKIDAKAGETVRRLIGRTKGIAAYAITKVDGVEQVKKLNSPFGPVRRHWYRMDWPSTYYCDLMADGLTYNHIRALTAFPEVMFEAEVSEDCEIYVVYAGPSQSSKYHTNLDCMKKDSFEEYKNRILERYAAAVGDLFGTKIPGIFIDEPTLGGNYSEELCEYFYNRYGYRLEDNLYKLYGDYEGDSAQLRRDYSEAMMSMFEENFLLPMKAWCEKHNLIVTGHFNGEEDLLTQASSGQNIYKQTKIMDVPGFDIITPNIGDLDHCALIFGANMVSSAAAQSGKKTIFSECFALSPYNMDYHGVRKTTDWLFACGINHIVPHGFHYGYSAYQRADAGKSFFFQDPYFDDYSDYAAYVGRVSKLLHDYERENDVLLVYPYGGFAEVVPFKSGCSPVKPCEKGALYNSRLRGAVRFMMKNHIGWDVSDTESAMSGEIVGGKLVIGECSYSKVAVIKAGEVEERVYERLKSAGIDCCLYDGDESFFPCGVEIVGGDRVQTYKKVCGDDKLIFLYNNSENYARINVRVGDTRAWVYDADNDLSRAVEVKDGFAELSMQRFGSVILLLCDEPCSDVGEVYVPEEEDPFIPEYVTDPQFTYMPKGARAAISYFDMKIERNGEIKDYGTVRRGALREYIGTHDTIFFPNHYYRPGFDIGKRMYNTYPCNATYSVKLDCVDSGDWLLFDKHSVEGNFKIFWNGEEITRDRFEKKTIYDMSNYVIRPLWREGENLLEIKIFGAQEFDGANGDVYVMRVE